MSGRQMVVLDSWQNRRGETVVVHAGGLVVLPAGQRVGATVRVTQEAPRNALAAVRQATRQVAALTEQLEEREVARIKDALKGSGAVALRDAASGFTAVVLPTKPYWLRNADELEALKTEAAELRVIVDNPNALFVEKQRAEARLREVERQIAVAAGEAQPWMRRSVHGPGGFPDA
jgi:hypothetical protein